jgi:hypothetical protein
MKIMKQISLEGIKQVWNNTHFNYDLPYDRIGLYLISNKDFNHMVKRDLMSSENIKERVDEYGTDPYKIHKARDITHATLGVLSISHDIPPKYTIFVRMLSPNGSVQSPDITLKAIVHELVHVVEKEYNLSNLQIELGTLSPYLR